MKPAISREAFLQFCESKPADEVYDYTDPFNCAFCQYLKSVGYKRPAVNPHDWRPDRLHDSNRRDLPAGVDQAALRSSHTFGALATRLREGV